MNCNVISSGSKGNAVILSDIILLDCGVPYKSIEPYVRGLKLVLLTHIHGDHFNTATIRRLHRERPTLRFGCGQWLVGPLIDCGVPANRIDIYSDEIGYCYGSVSVEMFPLVHDVDNCGYKILAGEERAIYATDAGNLDGISARDYDLYMIEANYTEAEIAERIQRKLETGEFIYEYQAAIRHLSKEKADMWLAQNATPGKSKVIYLHKHED